MLIVKTMPGFEPVKNDPVNYWRQLTHNYRESANVRSNPESKAGLLAVIDGLRGEKVNYIHNYTMAEGIIKKVKGNKIFIQDGYKLRRLDISLTYIAHSAIDAFIVMVYNDEAKFPSY